MSVIIHTGDCRTLLSHMAAGSVDCCVTSPPYFGLRDYGHASQLGLEPTPDEYVAGMVEVFRHVRRVLRDDGTLFLNIGDSYAGGKTGRDDAADMKCRHGGNDYDPGKGVARKPPAGLKPKDLIGIPWMLAFALRADGWYLRQEIIWHKPNPMPESVTDRCTKSHEYIFLLTKRPRYYFDAEAIAEPVALSQVGRVREDAIGGASHIERGQHSPGGIYRTKRDSFKRENSKRAEVFPGQSVGTHRPDRAESEYDLTTRNKRSVWTVATQPFSEAHFATFPPDLIEPCIKAGCPVGGTVLDPFFGAGTTGLVADRLQRNCIGIELNPEYATMARRRIDGDRGGLLDAMEAA